MSSERPPHLKLVVDHEAGIEPKPPSAFDIAAENKAEWLMRAARKRAEEKDARYQSQRATTPPFERGADGVFRFKDE